MRTKVDQGPAEVSITLTVAEVESSDFPGVFRVRQRWSAEIDEALHAWFRAWPKRGVRRDNYDLDVPLPSFRVIL